MAGITLRQIEAFKALMEAGTMIQAAELMYLTQPSISRLISELEYAIGYPLFERRKGRLHPCPEAHQLFAEVDRAFIGLGQIERMARSLAQRHSGQLRIVVMPALSSQMLPQAIAAFSRDNPEVSVTVDVRPRFRVIEWVASQQQDLGLATFPVENAALGSVLIGHAPCVCLIPSDHPLAQRDVITPELLRDVPFISIAAEALLRYQIDKVFDEARVARRMQIEASTAELSAALVGEGMGVTIGNTFGFHRNLPEKVRVVPFSPAINVGIYILFPANKSLHRSSKAFIQTYLEAAREQSALVPSSESLDDIFGK